MSVSKATVLDCLIWWFHYSYTNGLTQLLTNWKVLQACLSREITELYWLSTNTFWPGPSQALNSQIIMNIKCIKMIQINWFQELQIKKGFSYIPSLHTIQNRSAKFNGVNGEMKNRLNYAIADWLTSTSIIIIKKYININTYMPNKYRREIKKHVNQMKTD